MKKIFLVFISSLLLCVESYCQNVSIRFSPNGKRDKFCSQISLKKGFTPVPLKDPGMVSVWFEYLDGSVVFMTRRGWTPNIKSWNNGKKWEKGPYINQINLCNDTILVYAFEGVDSAAQYWKEMVYIDKRYIQDSIINTGWYKAVVGYYNVESEQKESYDLMLDSYIILPSNQYDFSRQKKTQYFMYVDN